MPPSCPECQPYYDNVQNQAQTLQQDASAVEQAAEALENIDQVYGSDWVQEYTQLFLTLASLGGSSVGFIRSFTGAAVTTLTPAQASLVGVYNSVANIINECIKTYNEMTSPSEESSSDSEVKETSDSTNNASQVGKHVTSLLGPATGVTTDFHVAFVKSLGPPSEEDEVYLKGLERFNFIVSTASTLAGLPETFKRSDSDGQKLELAEINLQEQLLRLNMQRATVDQAMQQFYDWQERPHCDPNQPLPPFHMPSNIPHDPNSIIGPSGFGAENFISINQVLPYQIDFENDPTAGLPA